MLLNLGEEFRRIWTIVGDDKLMSEYIKKILCVLFLAVSIVGVAYAVDTADEERTCSNLGFKRGTPDFGNCVMNLLNRKDTRQQNESNDARYAAEKASQCERAKSFYKACYFSCVGSTAGGLANAANICGTRCGAEKSEMNRSCN